jgi:phospholipase/carboxylesterase
MSLLPAVENETAANPAYSIIWLHGLGDDGHGFASIVPDLVSPQWPALRFVFPHAPVRPVTLNNGMAMRAWYDIYGFDRLARQDEAGIRQSIGHVEALIAREQERGVPSERILLAGFSQGGAIVLAAGLRHPQKLAGIIALSTYLPIADSLPAERSAANASVPIFWGHGTFDPVLTLQHGLDSRTALEALGYHVDWHTYPMAHAVSPEEAADLGHWIGQRLR